MTCRRGAVMGARLVDAALDAVRHGPGSGRRRAGSPPRSWSRRCRRRSRLRATLQPVAGRGAHVGDRLEVLRRAPPSPPRPLASFQGCADDRRLGVRARASGVAAMPPKASRAAATRSAVEPQSERRHHRRDVLVEPLADLVGAVARARRRLRHDDPLDELARPAVLLAVGDEEVLERQAAALARRGAACRVAPAAISDRRAVADRRAVGDVAADRAGVADLHRGEAPPHLAHVRIPAGQRRHRVAVADAGADLDRLRRSPRSAAAPARGRDRPPGRARASAW